MSNSLRLACSSLRAAGKRQSSRVLVRRAHTRKPLPYPIENGLGDFLSPAALNTLAVEYQQGLLDRLNEETRGTAHENKSVVQTIIETSWDRNQVLAFNYASEALNNSFWLESLTPPSTEDIPKGTNEVHIDRHLAMQIKQQFGSVTQLKSIISAHALGMFSSGWVWLVTDQKGALGAISTFGTGTLLIRSRRQMGGEDDTITIEASVNPDFEADSSRPSNPSTPPGTPPSPASPLSGVSSPSSPLNPLTQMRTLHTSSRASIEPDSFAPPSGIFNRPVGGETLDDTQSGGGSRQNLDATLGETLYPLFCVSVHERSWMSGGYGVWGKEEYMKRFWTVLDWKKVSARYTSVTRQEQQRRSG